MEIILKGREREATSEPIYFLAAGNGVFLVKRTPIFTSCLRTNLVVATPEAREEWKRLPDQEEYIEFTGPKIPKALLKQMVSFFVEVARRFRAEAVVLLYIERSEIEDAKPSFAPRWCQYHLVIPQQTVAAAGIKYQVEKAPPHLVKVGTAHSHLGGKAGHSTTDNADEVVDEGLHIVIGAPYWWYSRSSSISVRLVVDYHQERLDPREVFEDYSGRETIASLLVPIPSEWLARVRRW